MKKENLKHLLSQLHEGLHQSQEIDDEVKSLLQTLNQDIDTVLSHDDTPDDPIYAALGERAQELSANFAARHPHVEASLRELADMLGKMGV